jgi:hypothetical protein
MKILGSVPLYLHVGKVRILYFRGKFKNWGLAEDFYVTALIVLYMKVRFPTIFTVP